MRLMSVIMIFLAGFFSTGCMTLHVRSIDEDFAGLRATTERSHVVCMLLVHGMGGYSTGDPGALIDAVQKELRLQPGGVAASHEYSGRGGRRPGTLIRQDFIGGAGNMLRIYTLYWEPLTSEIKKRYLSYDDMPAVTNNRLPIHNEFKQLMMNGNVPDLFLYGGNFKAAVQKCVRTTLKQIRSDLGDEKDYEYFFVTFSLGSRIIFDVVDQMADDPNQSDGNEIVDRTASFFMMANQFPLYGLGAVPATTMPTEFSDSSVYKPMLKFVERKRHRRFAQSATHPARYPAPGALSIVAVNDPNDLFSYSIPSYVREQFPEALINVQLSVAKTAYLVPTYGYIANPLTAHTGYGHDPDVIKLIIDGGKATRRK